MLGNGKSSGVINEASNLLANQNMQKAADMMQTKEYLRNRDMDDVIPTKRHLLGNNGPARDLNAGIPVYDPKAEKADDREDRQLDSDDDAELEMLRERRRQVFKVQQIKQSEYINKQHGSYREIKEGDFFNTVVREKGGSDDVALHFFHKDFEKCLIMDRHLSELAPQLMSIKFAKIDVDKCPFLVERLRVNVLPCVLLFHNDVAVDRIIGFEDLGEDDLDQNALRERIISGVKKNPEDDISTF